MENRKPRIMKPEHFLQARGKLCLTQSELAHVLQKSEHCIWAYESGRRAIPEVVKLAITHLLAQAKARPQ